MNAMHMADLCGVAMSQLCEFEALLQFVSEAHHAFIFKSKPEIIELQQIAKHETANNVTQEQATHIHDICEKLWYIYQSLPKHARDTLNYDEDS